MRQLLCAVLIAVVVSVTLSPAYAVTATDQSLPFDGAGEKVYASAKNTWVPIIIFFALVALAVAFAFALKAVGGLTVRVAIAIAVLAIACTMTGLATLFPGITTSVLLP